MKTVSLSKNMVNNGSLILVNRQYPLCRQFSEKNLTSIGEGRNAVLLETQTATAMQRLLEHVGCGDQILPISGFRTLDEQTEIYQSSLISNGEAFTIKYVALPNHSEHQTGLAIDLALNQKNIDVLRPYFPYTGICKEFRSRALQFGFIERYPKGKEKITGIAHEPWHFRYVGAPHSKIMWEMGATLEEYLLWLKQFSYGNKVFTYAFCGVDFKIFYVDDGEREVLLDLENDFKYTVSGDNVGGFIVTVWREHK